MTPRTELVPESWDDLFDFLDPRRRDTYGPERDREAEARCIEIMRKLVCFFASRHCQNAEDLATETILRVAAKCREVDVSNFSDRVGYFYGVARNVIHESHRDGLRESSRLESLKRQLTWQSVPDPAAWKEREAVHRCLERCLGMLNPPDRRLIVQYHGEEEGTRKVTRHRSLADELGKSVNALRIEAYRIRKTLQRCVFQCLSVAYGGSDPPNALIPD